MENGQNGVEELHTRKIYLKLGTILVQIGLVSKIFKVPSDQISQNVGSRKSKSNYFRYTYY